MKFGHDMFIPVLLKNNEISPYIVCDSLISVAMKIIILTLSTVCDCHLPPNFPWLAENLESEEFFYLYDQTQSMDRKTS